MAATTRTRRGRRTMSEINMVPFIDVMLVLMIIFMVTAPMLSPGIIDIPTVGKASNETDQVITITIDKQLSISVESKPTKKGSPLKPAVVTNMDKVATVVSDLQAGQVTTPVIISADKHIEYDYVIRLMDKLQRAGVKRVGLAVQQSN